MLQELWKVIKQVQQDIVDATEFSILKKTVMNLQIQYALVYV